MHHLRIVVGNQYNPDGQECFVGGSIVEVTDDSFMKLIRPAVGYIPNAEAMAILKRGVFIVFAQMYIYYRPRSEKQCPVKRKWATDSPDILVPDC